MERELERQHLSGDMCPSKQPGIDCPVERLLQIKQERLCFMLAGVPRTFMCEHVCVGVKERREREKEGGRERLLLEAGGFAREAPVIIFSKHAKRLWIARKSGWSIHDQMWLITDYAGGYWLISKPPALGKF